MLEAEPIAARKRESFAHVRMRSRMAPEEKAPSVTVRPQTSDPRPRSNRVVFPSEIMCNRTLTSANALCAYAEAQAAKAVQWYYAKKGRKAV